MITSCESWQALWSVGPASAKRAAVCSSYSRFSPSMINCLPMRDAALLARDGRNKMKQRSETSKGVSVLPSQRRRWLVAQQRFSPSGSVSRQLRLLRCLLLLCDNGVATSDHPHFSQDRLLYHVLLEYWKGGVDRDDAKSVAGQRGQGVPSQLYQPAS